MPKPTVEARLSLHEREIAAIRKLIMQGVKLMVSTQKQLNRLADDQRLTEKKLRALIQRLGRGAQMNGKTRGNGTIQ